MASSSRRPTALRRSGPLYISTASDPSPFTSASTPTFASSTSYYSTTSSSTSPSAGFFGHRRSASPTRVSLHALSPLPPTPSVRFAIDRSISPRRSIAAVPSSQIVRGGGAGVPKRTCLCSPTTHPGSFRCALHKNSFGGGASRNNNSVRYSPTRLNMRRSAMTNSLVRIGTVEGDLVKRALAALIRPSSHQQRRREDFRPHFSSSAAEVLRSTRRLCEFRCPAAFLYTGAFGSIARVFCHLCSSVQINYPSTVCRRFPFSVAVAVICVWIHFVSFQ
ncbi:serine-rich protein-related [Striga hermonthica]|uniref:Serine-rich protein-related n=1 Tax=Striga hermonthica TaxID=68872 RepID=A0A9N7RCE2_STRHE|nr:serine-rich protein-related [Striga hermonthica]